MTRLSPYVTDLSAELHLAVSAIETLPMNDSGFSEVDSRCGFQKKVSIQNYSKTILMGFFVCLLRFISQVLKKIFSSLTRKHIN